MKRITLALGVALAALVAAAPVAARSAATVPTVTVTMKEFKFTLTKRTVVNGTVMIKPVTKVRHGKVTFKLVNRGKLKHDFKIAGKKSKLISPGKTGFLTVTLRTGRLPYTCTVPGHAAAGMKGKLTVT
jgi:uncharacterized cupredoxin-like copper-binding protein